MAYRTHRPESLRRLVREMVVAAGWPEAAAAETADHLVLANLSGHDSHGVGMLPLYFQSLADGNLSPQSQPTTRLEVAPFLIIDAAVALGQPTARTAVDRASAMAKTSGVAIVNLLDAHHIGRIGHYAEVAAAQGLISLFWVNVAGARPSWRRMARRKRASAPIRMRSAFPSRAATRSSSISRPAAWRMARRASR